MGFCVDGEGGREGWALQRRGMRRGEGGGKGEMQRQPYRDSPRLRMDG